MANERCIKTRCRYTHLVWDRINREWVTEGYMKKLTVLRRKHKKYYETNALEEALLEEENLEVEQRHLNNFKPRTLLACR